jgi:hypothetical protein
VSRNTLSATTNWAAPAIAQGNGGGIEASILKVTNSTVALNRVLAAAPAVGGMAHAAGGGIQAPTDAPSSLVSSTVAKNAVAASGASTSALGGGVSADSDLAMRATILAGNVGTTAPDCVGGPRSAGYNLIRTAAGCGFSAKSSDRLGRAAGLGSLGWNGGPTQTMALSKGSAARNVIAASACAVKRDERGVRRPQGGRCDIGAYERRVG